MYTLDEINVLLSDLDACGRGDSCSDCSRHSTGPVKHMGPCFALDKDAAAVIRWLLSEFDRYAVEQLPIGKVNANA